jgi:hypothetical protein
MATNHLSRRSASSLVRVSCIAHVTTSPSFVSELLESDRSQTSSHSVMSRRADGLSDEQLMTNLDGPEVEVVLSKLYDRYSRTVYGVGLKILGDRSTAEELVQDVFLKVWRSSRTFDSSRSSFSTWLYRRCSTRRTGKL